MIDLSTQPATRTILGVEWSADGPQIRVRDDRADTSTLIDPAGVQLSYRLDDAPTRTCVGHHSQTSGYIECTSKPEDRKRTCVKCSIAEATFASQLHHAHTEPERLTNQSMIDHMQQPNVLYLAAFRDGSVKIGTSTAVRSEKRLLEQGAWRARLVAEATDGLAVRVVEDLITRELFVPQSVSASRKLSGLCQPLSDDDLDARLDPLAETVERLITDQASEHVVSTNTLWTNPASNDPLWSQVRSYPNNLKRGAHNLTLGSFVGRMAAARHSESGDHFAIDLQPIYGIELELGDHQPDEVAVQDQLF